MPIALYMDVHIPRAITNGLRMLEVDVITAQEDDDAATLPDPQLLDRATSLGRALFTFDDDLLVEAVRRQRENISFAGVIYIHLREAMIKDCIDDLELIAKVEDPDTILNQIQYLPL